MANITKLTLPTNATNEIDGTFSFFQWVQEVSSNWFFSVLGFAIFIITFIALKDYEAPKAFAFSSFILMIYFFFMSVVGFISKTFLYLSIILVGVAIVWLHLNNSDMV